MFVAQMRLEEFHRRPPHSKQTVRAATVLHHRPARVMSSPPQRR